MSLLRRCVAGALAVVLATTIAGCAPALSDSGEPLTIEQSETLAQVRFQQAAAGVAVLEIAIGADDDLDHLVADVTVDFENLLAWGTVERGPEGIAVTEDIAFSPELYVVDAGSGWQRGASPSPLLSVVFALADDRPENAQLLRQSDARYLGTADDGGDTLHVFRMPSAGDAPARTRMWLDEDGGLRRMDAGDDTVLVVRPTGAEPEPRDAELDAIFEVGDE